ncbi:MAG: NAD(P)/FAD-dependent oxidoreductase [Acidaminococcaceae bacterium]|jgi:NADPH-dependent 2,4-dienoyl-CoA reductase/sulfur reductase-like enzyme|nr:NAD(P)/FAD-dependent oxidoreductase [Acidaminococcaceae bacterium]MCI2110134.1 NAD(P)/FAD-dependent oxidoreductase [Acidaminococcaceae bacterium]
MRQCEVLVIGGGPAGLSAAIEAAKAGAQVVVVETNREVGGQLVKQTHKFFGSSRHRAGTRGIDIAKILRKQCEDLHVELKVNSLVMGIYADNVVAIDEKKSLTEHNIERIQAKKIVISTGASENSIRFPGWTLPGVMGAGAIQTMCNYHRVIPGRKLLMIGSGSVGLIVCYQLMQAGAEIVGIVEALPHINGYAVHASKLTREGIPIYTGYTIKEARGKERVEQAVIAKVNPDWSTVPGSEIVLDTDIVAVGAGLKPLIGMAHMSGCEFVYDKALGGWAPCHNKNMESTHKGIYVAGDTTGLEEASTAIEEGTISGIAIAESLGYIPKDKAKTLKDEGWERLAGLRSGFKGEDRVKAKMKQLNRYDEVMKGGK